MDLVPYAGSGGAPTTGLQTAGAYLKEIDVEPPAKFVIGTKTAFARGYPFEYGWDADFATWICKKGSEYSKPGEKLAFLYSSAEAMFYAYDVEVSPQGLLVRQPVFRTKSLKFFQPGWYEWDLNTNASPDSDAEILPEWQTGLWAETRSIEVTAPAVLALPGPSSG